jgi:hypothetical protein
LAWGRGDPRLELKHLYIELLAATIALRQTYPHVNQHTKAIHELYDALLPLYVQSEWTRDIYMNTKELSGAASLMGKRSYAERLKRLGIERISEIARENGKKGGRPPKRGEPK